MVKSGKFPASRIKKIIQEDEEIGKIANGVPVLISSTVEYFVEDITRMAGALAEQRGAKVLSLSHIKEVVMKEQQFDFLRDSIKHVPDLGPFDAEAAKAAGAGKSSKGNAKPKPKPKPKTKVETETETKTKTETETENNVPAQSVKRERSSENDKASDVLQPRAKRTAAQRVVYTEEDGGDVDGGDGDEFVPMDDDEGEDDDIIEEDQGTEVNGEIPEKTKEKEKEKEKALPAVEPLAAVVAPAFSGMIAKPKLGDLDDEY